MTDTRGKVPGETGDASSLSQLDGGSVRRTLIGAVLIGAFLAIVGAFGTSHVPIATRAGMLIATALIGAGTGMGAYVIAGKFPGLGQRPMARGFVGGLLQSVPMTLVIMTMSWISDGKISMSGEFLETYPLVLLVCLTMSVLAPALNHQAKLVQLARIVLQAKPTAPRFLDRLPMKLRGADVWAVEADDHYLRVHTSKGQDLILLRLSDAMDELTGLEGEQVHRSWWVARDGVADVARSDGRAVLTLKNGVKAPVSRTYARIIREKGWL